MNKFFDLILELLKFFLYFMHSNSILLFNFPSTYIIHLIYYYFGYFIDISSFNSTLFFLLFNICYILYIKII